MNPISFSVILNEVKNPVGAANALKGGNVPNGFFAPLLMNRVCVARASRPWVRNTGGTPVPL
ncbi:MAG: hypothetical protein ABIO94_07695, partial [Opitutaceae bacterium]